MVRPQDESWDGVVDREIKLEPKASKVADGQPVLPEFFHGEHRIPYWYTRKFEECDGDVLEVRRAKALACAYAHTTPTVYPKDLLPGGRPVICAEDFQCPG